jgi:SAM-dependent methyltransferase
MKSGTLSVHTSLLSAMLGASIALAIDAGTTGESVWVLIAIVVLVLHAVNFYHGKMLAFDEVRATEVEARPIVRSTLLLSNVTDPVFLAAGEVGLRAVDIAIVGSDLRIGDRIASVRSMLPSLREQLRYWQMMNIVALVDFGAILAAMAYLPAGARYPLVVSVLALLVVVDLAIEYWGFRSNYFQHRDDSWNMLAERWDRLQGEYGDVYRSRVIHPYLLRWAEAHRLKTVLDLGCGNGCTARTLTDRAPLRVVAVDSAADMIEIAQLYEHRRTSPRPIDYLVSSVDAAFSASDATQPCTVKRRIDDRRRDFGVCGGIAIFTAQDCDDLAGFFAVAGELLVAGEPLLVVFESDVSFDPTSHHTVTQRTWKYSLRREDRVQVVTWLPVAETAPSSVFAHGGPDRSPPINVETHYRTLEQYVRAAAAAGIDVVTHGDIKLAGAPETPAELRYARAPKFVAAQFVRV